MLNKFLRIVEVDATDYKQAFKDLMKISPEKFAQLLPGVLKVLPLPIIINYQ